MKWVSSWLLVLPFLFFSCASSYTKNKKIVVKHSTDEKVELTSFNSGEKIEEKKEGSFDVSNKDNGYIVTTFKDNFHPVSKVITRKKFNKVKLLDVLVPLACNIAMITVPSGVVHPIGEVAITITGVAGWFWAFKGPWKVYDKYYEAPTPLLPYPQKRPEQPFISSLDFSVNVPQENYTIYSYSDYDGFLSKSTKGAKTEKQLPTETKNFTRDELQVLDKFKLSDTSRTIFSSKLTDLKLVVNVKTLDENLILNTKQIQSKTEVSLLNNFSKTALVSKEIDGITQWRRNIVLHGTFNFQYQNELINDVLAKFLNDAEVQKTLSEHTNKMKEKVGEKFDYLTIPTVQESVKTIPEAVKAVVTVVTKDGHGSGCVISNNGYIITNSHVIANNDTNITVLFSDSTHHKAKLIVANLDDDLALLKIDTTLNYCFDVNKSKSIEIGTEVYAIGAYSIDDYTVSISKGIISSFRKVDGKDYIQTDVTINSGNSGGALINAKGELMGVVTAKMVGEGIEGIGFVIPYNKIKESLKIKFE